MADANIKHVEYKQNPKVRGQDIRPFAVKNANMGAVNTSNQPVIIPQGLSSLNNFSVQNAAGESFYVLTEISTHITQYPLLTFTLINNNINVFLLAVVELDMTLKTAGAGFNDSVSARITINNGAYVSGSSAYAASAFSGGDNNTLVSLTIPYLVALPPGKYTVDIEAFMIDVNTNFTGAIPSYNITSLVFGS